MNRLSKRKISLLAVATLGSVGAAAFFGAIEGGCVFGTPSVPPEASVCNALAGYFQSCVVSSACQAAYVRDCAKVSSALSETAVNSLFACAEDGVLCGDAGAAVVSTCAVTGYAYATPSTAQEQLATDYCRVCAPTDTACVANFYSAGGGAGTGLTSMNLAGDTTVQSVDSTCTPRLSGGAGTAACAATFAACAAPIAAAGFYIPPECVNDAGLGDSG